MSDSVIRNQRAFLFAVDVASGSNDVFVLGPLQTGEVLEEIFIELFCSTGSIGSATLEVSTSDNAITSANFLSDAISFLHNGIAIIIGFVLVRHLTRVIRLPMHRSATDRERFFAVRLTNVDLVGVLNGSVSFSVRYFPESVDPS